MAKKPLVSGKPPKGPRGRPTIAGMLRLVSLASRAKPVLPKERMISLMRKALAEARSLGNKEAFEYIYTRGENEAHAAIFSRLKIPKDGAKLLSLAIGGMYRPPDKAALSELVGLYGAGKARYWVSMFGRIASNELPGAKYVMESIRFGSGAGKSSGENYDHSSPELVVTDMFVQPLVTIGMVAKMLLPKINKLGREQKKLR